MSADITNGVFELLAAVFILNHCRVLYADKMTRGVSIVSTIFFFLWGLWNVYYYPSLDQVWSYRGGLCVVTANALWVALLLYYKRKELY